MTQDRMLKAGVLIVLLVGVWVVFQGCQKAPERARVTHPAPMETDAETSTPTAAAPSPTSASADETSAVDPAVAAASVKVHVVGAVRRPGVYPLPQKARLADAIKAAGGAKAGADMEAVNLASFVQDGEQIRVPTLAERRALRTAAALRSSVSRALPRQPQPRPVRSTARYPLAAASATASAPAGSGGVVAAAGGVVNVNTATAEELDTLPGVGPSTAAAILDFRKEHGPFQRVEDLLEVRGIGEKKLAAMRDRVTVK